MSSPSDLSKALNKTISRMLRPLVKLLMKKGITYIGLLELLKRSFVEVAIKEKSFHLDNKKQTDSRVSLLSGVHRAEVKRIRQELDTPLTDKEIKASVSAQIMAIWLGHPDYIDENGHPKALLRHKDDSAEIAFEDLVFEVSRDKHPRSILDDWLNQDLVEVDDKNRIVLKQNGYTGSSDMEEKLFFAGKNIGEHLETVTHNLTEHDDPRYDRAIYYKNLSAESVAEIEQLAKDELTTVLKKLNQKAAQLQKQDEAAEAHQHAIHIGAYFARRKEDE